MSNVADDLTAKRVQLFKTTVPNLKRMGVMFNPAGANPTQMLGELRSAAAILGVEVILLEVRSPAEIEDAIGRASAQRLDGIAIAQDSMILNSRERLAALALQHRLPTMGSNVDTVTAGLLIGYGANHADIFRRSAAVVDQILKGERPGNIPVQQPVTFNLRINLKTANALNIHIPPQLLATADDVID